MQRLAIWVMTTAFCLAWAFGAGAAEKREPLASDEPINVVSDSLEVDNEAQIANFIGTVKATQGDVTIFCDTLQVYYDRPASASQEPEAGQGGEAAQGQEDSAQAEGLMDDGGQVTKVVALGHVNVRQKDRVALGRKATYWAGARKILLEGDATVWRGQNQVSGEQITVFLDEDRSVVHGKPGKRVSVTFVPGGGKGAPAGDKAGQPSKPPKKQ